MFMNLRINTFTIPIIMDTMLTYFAILDLMSKALQIAYVTN